MNEFKISWSKVAVWCVIFLICIAVWFWLAWQFKGCAGCNNNNEQVTEQAVADPVIQVKIDSLMVEVKQLKASNDSLEKCLDEMEMSRHENIVYAKTESKIVENKPAKANYENICKWIAVKPIGPIITNLIPYDKEKDVFYAFDSSGVLRLMKKKIENEYLITDNKLLGDEIINYKSQIANYKWQVSDLTKINQFKDEQIVKLEALPRVTVNKRKWYVDLGIITGSIAVGFVGGIIYQNNRK